MNDIQSFINESFAMFHNRDTQDSFLANTKQPELLVSISVGDKKDPLFKKFTDYEGYEHFVPCQLREKYEIMSKGPKMSTPTAAESGSLNAYPLCVGYLPVSVMPALYNQMINVRQPVSLEFIKVHWGSGKPSIKNEVKYEAHLISSDSCLNDYVHCAFQQKEISHRVVSYDTKGNTSGNESLFSYDLTNGSSGSDGAAG